MTIPFARRVTGIALVACLSTSTMPAGAATSHATSAAGACHVANGAAAGKMTYGNSYVTNSGTTDQWVICHFQMDDPDSPNDVDFLSVDWLVPTAGGTPTCVASTGHYSNGALTMRASVMRILTTTTTNQAVTMQWTGLLPRVTNDDVLMLNCKMPAGARMGLIRRSESAAF